MRFVINSRKLGREIIFSRPGEGHIYVHLAGGESPSDPGDQICHHGGLVGNPIRYRGESAAAFAAVCRRWWRAYIRDLRASEIA